MDQVETVQAPRPMNRQQTITKEGGESKQIDTLEKSPSGNPSVGNDIDQKDKTKQATTVVRQGTFEKGPEHGSYSGSTISGLRVPVIDDEPVRFVSGHGGIDASRTRDIWNDKDVRSTSEGSVQGSLSDADKALCKAVVLRTNMSNLPGPEPSPRESSGHNEAFLTEINSVTQISLHDNTKSDPEESTVINADNIVKSPETREDLTGDPEFRNPGSLRIENVDLQKENKRLSLEVNSLKETMARHREEAQDKEKADMHSKEETVRMQSEALNATKNLHALQREFNELKLQVDEIEGGNKSKLDTLEKDKAILTLEIQKLRQTNKELRNIVAILEKDKLTWGHNKQQLQTETQQQHLVAQDLKNEIGRLEEEIEQMRGKEKEEKRQAVESNRKSETLNMERETVLSQLSGQSVELQRLRQDAMNQQEHVTGLFEKIYELNKQLDKLLEHNGNLLISLGKERTKSSNLEKQVRAVGQENRELVKRLTDMDMRSSSLHLEDEKTRELENRIKRLTEENKKLRLGTTEKEFEITNSQAERRDLKTKLESLEIKQLDSDERMRQLQDWLDEVYVHREELSHGSVSERIFNRSELRFPPRLSGILPDVREKDAQLSVTMNYSTRRKHLQQLRKQKRW